MPAVALAYAARFLPALALVVAAWLGVVAIRQHQTIAELNAKYDEARAALTDCQARTAAIEAQGASLALRATQASTEAQQARQKAAKALAAYAARPVAPTCEAAIVELSDALGGRQ